MHKSMSLKYEPSSESLHRGPRSGTRWLLLLLFTLVTGPRRSLSLTLSDTRVYEPQIRALLGVQGATQRHSVEKVLSLLLGRCTEIVSSRVTHVVRTGSLRPYPEYSRANSYPWSPFPPRRARPGPGAHTCPRTSAGGHAAALGGEGDEPAAIYI